MRTGRARWSESTDDEDGVEKETTDERARHVVEEEQLGTKKEESLPVRCCRQGGDTHFVGGERSAQTRARVYATSWSRASE